ncbi:MAG: hypothetical protein WEB88_16655 [Gemmatimonadota bacterium]
MKRILILTAATGAFLLSSAPAELAAQGKVNPRTTQERVEQDRSDRGWEDIILGRRDAERGQADRRAQAGPPFCRNGQGHPVHGRRWCAEKGFGVGTGLGSLGDIRWEEEGWGDVILRAPRNERDVIQRGGLLDVLGSVILGRFDQQAQRLGSGEPLTGRWLEGRDGPRVLWLQAGQTPVAQLLDTDRDGRVDRIRLNGGR